MTSGPPGSGEPRPPDEDAAPPDPAAVTAPYTTPVASTTTGGPAPVTPPPPAAPTSAGAVGTGLPPGVGWAPPVPVRQEVAPGLALSDTFPRVVAWIVDAFLLGIVGLVIGEILAALGWARASVPLRPDGQLDYAQYFAADVGTVLSLGIGAAYFIASWSGGRRATIGQRLLKIQVGNAFDGRSLTLDQAIRRWLGFGDFIVLIGFVPGLAGLGWLVVLWQLVLLITTATSPTKQGLHDRLANSAVVRPVDAGNSLVMACAVIAVILVAFVLLSIVALIFLGSQVSDILSAAGESV